MIYRIRDWSKNFETAKSRDYKTLTWIAVPVNLGGAFMHALHDEFEERAAAMYGVWIAVLQLAAEMPCRGLFADSRGNPVPLRRMARVTMFDIQDIESVLTWAQREGWVEFLNPEDLPSPCKVPDESPAGPLPNLTLPNPNTPQPPKGGEGASAALEGKTEDSPEEIPPEVVAAWEEAKHPKMPAAEPGDSSLRSWRRRGSPGPAEVQRRVRAAAASDYWLDPPLAFSRLFGSKVWEALGELPEPQAPAPKPIEDRGRQAMVAAEVAWRSGNDPEALRLAAIAEHYASTEDEARHLRQQIETPFKAERPAFMREEEVKA